MGDEIQLRHASVGSSDFDEILLMADAMRSSLVARDFDWEDPSTMAKAMAASAMYCGMLFGQLIVMGAARDQDRRRAGETMLTNFRQGTDAGKRRAFRIAAELGGGGISQ